MHGGSNNAYKGTFLLTLWFVHWSETEQQLESELVKPEKAYLGGHKFILFSLQYYTAYFSESLLRETVETVLIKK